MHMKLPARSSPIRLPAHILVALALLLTTAPAAAAVVEIVWDEAGRFQHVTELGAGDFAEVCGKLSREERVDWAFEASAALDFNIHYHVGDEVVYPEAVPDTVDRDGVLVAPVDQTYCWMWTNRQSSPATLTLHLSH